MTENQAIVLILTGIVAIILYSFWRKILFVLLMMVITIHCFGAYSFANRLEA